ncbi:hypothetical protein RHABOEDO_001198 [Candidatus Rhabdochlamydia oedothoracis]|uniref:Uncharacterized protein n=1 Tax=Candidatus Rhabdochlamydia oedothoracis TaxID=2720720 RepID=A0ABX8V6V1_9BACT|nr:MULTISPECIES: hypothetical protein [Rhabdochlamydia]KAG6558655.1 hypothetical protein RHOW815_001356 [Candidatus Rhabdochlamydia sp. W815]QYF48954.1 hypothetical protein RHABOEDO_001198 [Candidatus Rhabdochlamydia oedothoracis]
MSGPIQSLADAMSTYNTSRRFIQEQREKADAERRTRVNKEYEKALSTSSKSESECKCKCKEKPRSEEFIKWENDLDRRLAKFDRENRARWDEAHRKLQEDSSCTIS